MQVRIERLLFLLVLSSLPDVYAASAEEHMNRYERDAYDLMLEQIWGNEVRQRAEFDQSQQGYSFMSRPQASAAVKAEWYLRRGKFGAPLVLADLFEVNDLALVDQALWRILGEATNQQIFGASADWNDILRVMRSFLNAYPKGKALETAQHGQWWTWLRTGVLPENADSELSAIHYLLRARKGAARPSHEQLVDRSIDYVRTLLHLQEDSLSSQRRLVATEWAEAYLESSNISKDRSARVQKLSAFAEALRTKNVAGGELGLAFFFRSVGDAFVKKEKRVLAAVSTAIGLELLESSGKELSLMELLQVADLHYETEDWKRAHVYYARVLEKMLRESHEYFSTAEAQKAELHFLIARHQVQESKNMNVEQLRSRRAEYETVLAKVFHSIHRDDAIVAYAEFLEDSASKEEARQAWAWGFQFGNSRDTREHAAENLLRIMESSFLSDQQSPESLMQSLGLMQSIAKAKMAKQSLSQALTQIESAAQKKGLSGRADWQASMRELRSTLRAAK